jgi:glycosyltransferase involved in cell wall biosynthesis
VRTPLVSIVVTTYEWPQALDLVFHALSEQSDPAFEVVVADDGSGPETADVVNRWRDELEHGIVHVRQADEGWRKTHILNRGAHVARGEYLVFLDGDCIPRRGFLHAVRSALLPGWFLAGKRLQLSERLSLRVLEEQIPVWRWSTVRWCLGAPRELLSTPRKYGRLGLFVPVRSRKRPWRSEPSEFVPPFGTYGFFFGVARDDFERVNGFDLRFCGWGGEDEDLAARLRRTGLKCGWPGVNTTLIHLWHPKQEHANLSLMREALASSHVEAPVGLRELRAELSDQVSANRVGASSPSSEPVKR